MRHATGGKEAAARAVDVRRFGRHAVQLDDLEIAAFLKLVQVTASLRRRSARNRSLRVRMADPVDDRYPIAGVRIQLPS